MVRLQAPDLELARLERLFQNRLGRRRFRDVDRLVFYLLAVQKFLRLAAGTALVVSVKFHRSLLRQLVWCDLGYHYIWKTFCWAKRTMYLF